MAFGAMVALARRAEQGGSWLVRLSLAQIGKWLADLGEVPEAALAQAPAEFDKAELEAWSMVSQTPSGPLRHLKPVVQMSETEPFWARPSVPLGYHRPVWPARGAAWRVGWGLGGFGGLEGFGGFGGLRHGVCADCALHLRQPQNPCGPNHARTQR